MGAKPVKTLRLSGIEGCFWENQSKDNKRFLSFSLKKNYKTEDGWKDTDYFSEYDLPALAAVVNKALNEIVFFKGEKSMKKEDNHGSELDALVHGQLERVSGEGDKNKQEREKTCLEAMEKLSFGTNYRGLTIAQKAMLYTDLCKMSSQAFADLGV